MEDMRWDYHPGDWMKPRYLRTEDSHAVEIDDLIGWAEEFEQC
jgi:hypothetical protein